MDIEEAVRLIVAAKDETIALQEKYYDNTVALLQQSMKANFDTFASQNNYHHGPIEETLSQEELMELDQEPGITGGEL